MRAEELLRLAVAVTRRAGQHHRRPPAGQRRRHIFIGRPQLGPFGLQRRLVGICRSQCLDQGVRTAPCRRGRGRRNLVPGVALAAVRLTGAGTLACAVESAAAGRETPAAGWTFAASALRAGRRAEGNQAETGEQRVTQTHSIPFPQDRLPVGRLIASNSQNRTIGCASATAEANSSEPLAHVQHLVYCRPCASSEGERRRLSQ